LNPPFSTIITWVLYIIIQIKILYNHVVTFFITKTTWHSDLGQMFQHMKIKH